MYEEFVSASEQSAQLENYKAKTDILVKKLAETKSHVAQLNKVFMRFFMLLTIFFQIRGRYLVIFWL